MRVVAQQVAHGTVVLAMREAACAGGDASNITNLCEIVNAQVREVSNPRSQDLSAGTARFEALAASMADLIGRLHQQQRALRVLPVYNGRERFSKSFDHFWRGGGIRKTDSSGRRDPVARVASPAVCLFKHRVDVL